MFWEWLLWQMAEIDEWNKATVDLYVSGWDKYGITLYFR